MESAVPSGSPAPSRLHGLLSRAVGFPAVTAFAVALIARVVVAVAVNFATDGVLIPDEATYMRIADLRSTGDLSAEPTLRCIEYANADGTPLWCSYWRGLFAATRTFSWPLTALIWVFGPHQIVGRLLACLFGALAAGATAQLASGFLRKPFALIAGLIVALLPSQVLLSSVVLRESAIWLCLACLGVSLGKSDRLAGRGGVALTAVGLALLFVLLAWLRIQTAALALWCAVPVFAIVGRHRRARVVFATVVLVITPMLVGLGPAGEGFVRDSLVRLGYSRNVMSIGAETAFDYSAWSRAAPRRPGQEELLDPFALPSSPKKLLDPSVLPPTSTIDDQQTAGMLELLTRDTETENLLDTLLILPSGLYNTMVRPFLWRPSDIRSASAGHVLAGLEAPLWVTGYLFAAAGSVLFRRRVDVIGFPVLIVLAIAISGAATHGNLGTAFRHRGQVLFAIAVLGAAGLEALIDRLHMVRNQGAGAGPRAGQ